MICSITEGLSFRFGMLLADVAVLLIALTIIAIMCAIYFLIIYWVEYKAKNARKRKTMKNEYQ
jgi:Flp pilus assembly protein TadB